jgi:hypothetical protein
MEPPVPKFEIGNYVETVQQGPYDHSHVTEAGFIIGRSLTFVPTKRDFIEMWLYKTTISENRFFPEYRLRCYTREEIEEKLARNLEEYEKISQPKRHLWLEKFKGAEGPEIDKNIKYMEEQQQKQMERTTYYINKYKDIIEKFNLLKNTSNK